MTLRFVTNVHKDDHGAIRQLQANGFLIKLTPQATASYTSAELSQMGMLDVYKFADLPEEPRK